jgi:electron transport complex protein RnfD
MTALGAVFAVVVAKEFFGGLGANVFNPALTGRAFLVMSFPAALTTWQQPVLPLFSSFSVDAVTGATPLGITKMGGSIADAGQSLAQYGLSQPDYWPFIKTLFFGFRAGSIGETSIFLIICAGLFLGLTKVIDWRTPLCMLASGFIFALALGLDPVYSITAGGFVFGAVFMATDYVTSPITGKGKIIFGACIGLITMLIRKWGTYPEGTSFAILIMNAAVPFLNKLLPVKYGAQKKKFEIFGIASLIKKIGREGAK